MKYFSLLTCATSVFSIVTANICMSGETQSQEIMHVIDIERQNKIHESDFYYSQIIPEINMSLMDLANNYQNVYENIVNNPEAVKAIKAQLDKTEYTITDFYKQLIYACNDDSEKPYMLIAKMLDTKELLGIDEKYTEKKYERN